MALNFQQLFEAAPGAYLVLATDAPKFTILAANHAYLQATKTQQQNILGRGLFEIFSDSFAGEIADGVQNLRRSIETVIATCAVDAVPIQKYVPRSAAQENGFEERDWKLINSPVLDADGNVAQIIHHLEDVTEWMQLQQRQATQDPEQSLHRTLRSLQLRNEQMETEADLRSQELETANHQLQIAYAEAEVVKLRLEHILSSIQDGFYVLDSDWRYTYINDRQLEMIQQRREDVIGKSVWELFPEAIDSDAYQQMQQVAIDRTPTQFEFLHSAWNRWFEHRVFPFDGGVSVACTEITDRKLAESTLRESEARFRAYAENSKDVIWITAAQDYRLVYLSPSYESVWGRSIADLFIDLTQFMQSVHPDDRDSMINGWQQCAQGLFMQEYRIIRPDGEIRWIYDRGFPIYDDSDTLIYVGGIAQDITDRKNAERDREALLQREQKAREEAERANRLKDEFLAVLSHELRSPLNPILGWTRLLRTRSFDAQATDRALETIERNAKLQTQLIEDLLDVSRILQGKLVLNVQPVNLKSTIEAAIETVRLAAEAKSIELDAQLADLAPVAGEANRLQQVVWNLLANAIKFTPEGRVEIRLAAVGNFAQIQVQDTGIGIAPEFLPYVFDYFRQQDSKTTRRFGGLGLGLAIVRHIVELHGGSVFVGSAGEGQGTTFTVELPLMRSVAQQSIDLDSRLSPSDFPLIDLNILVIDNEPDMRDLLVAILEPSGATAQVAASAAEALRAIDTSQFDLLICDIGMPDIDGYMLMRQLRSANNRTPAIALTAFASEHDRAAAIAAGFQLHLGKPIDPVELVKTIATLINRSR